MQRLEELNQALEQARQSLEQEKKNRAVREELVRQREERRRAERESAEILSREREDVKRLERVSLTALFAALKGNKDEALARERREELAASLRYAQAVRDLEDITRRLEELDHTMPPPGQAEEAYRRALEEKEAYLCQEGGELGTHLARLEAAQAGVAARRKEIGEAQRAGRALLGALDQMAASLDGAEQMGTWDIWGGGMLVTMAKHEHLDEARWAAGQVERLLRDFHTELADVSMDMSAPTVEVGEFATFADYFFDGIFADLAVQNQIHASQDSVVQTASRVRQVMCRLEEMDGEEREEARRLKETRNSLIERA